MVDADPRPETAGAGDPESGAACAQPPKKPKKSKSAKPAKGAKQSKAAGAAKPDGAAEKKPAKPDPAPDAKPDGAAEKKPAKPDPAPEAKPETKSDAPDAGKEDGAGVPAKVDEEPEPKVYTPEEIEAIANKVETYSDRTPRYEPKNVLSPEFEGTSNYERGIVEFRAQKADELERLSRDPEATGEEIAQARDGLRILDHLYENYHQGMNVFRTAKGGRSKLRA